MHIINLRKHYPHYTEDILRSEYGIIYSYDRKKSERIITLSRVGKRLSLRIARVGKRLSLRIASTAKG